MRSLESQTYKNFELIVVDQNEDARLAPVLAEYKSVFPVSLLHCRPGLSRARNIALPHIQGDVVGFPDDDCWYPPDLLQGICERFESYSEWDAFSVRRAADDEETVALRRAIVPLNRLNLWGRVPSISLFLKRSLIESVGNFDETLGVGAGTPWGAGEDTDYVLRSMALGAKWGNDLSLRVFHAPPLRGTDAAARQRARAYARGLGRVLRKNRLPLWMVFGGCCLSAWRAFGALMQGRIPEACWHYETLQGRISGWLSASGQEISRR
jgi:glycosyltransferase involved in cell wall biosynthesis